MTQDQTLFKFYFENNIRTLIKEYSDRLKEGELNTCLERKVCHYLDIIGLFTYFYILTDQEQEIFFQKIVQKTQDSNLLSLYQKIYT